MSSSLCLNGCADDLAIAVVLVLVKDWDGGLGGVVLVLVKDWDGGLGGVVLLPLLSLTDCDVIVGTFS